MLSTYTPSCDCFVTSNSARNKVSLFSNSFFIKAEDKQESKHNSTY